METESLEKDKKTINLLFSNLLDLNEELIITKIQKENGNYQDKIEVSKQSPEWRNRYRKLIFKLSKNYKKISMTFALEFSTAIIETIIKTKPEDKESFFDNLTKKIHFHKLETVTNDKISESTCGMITNRHKNPQYARLVTISKSYQLDMRSKEFIEKAASILNESQQSIINIINLSPVFTDSETIQISNKTKNDIFLDKDTIRDFISKLDHFVKNQKHNTSARMGTIATYDILVKFDSIKFMDINIYKILKKQYSFIDMTVVKDFYKQKDLFVYKEYTGTNKFYYKQSRLSEITDIPPKTIIEYLKKLKSNFYEQYKNYDNYL